MRIIGFFGINCGILSFKIGEWDSVFTFSGGCLSDLGFFGLRNILSSDSSSFLFAKNASNHVNSSKLLTSPSSLSNCCPVTGGFFKVLARHTSSAGLCLLNCPDILDILWTYVLAGDIGNNDLP